MAIDWGKWKRLEIGDIDTSAGDAALKVVKDFFSQLYEFMDNTYLLTIGEHKLSLINCLLGFSICFVVINFIGGYDISAKSNPEDYEDCEEDDYDYYDE